MRLNVSRLFISYHSNARSDKRSSAVNTTGVVCFISNISLFFLNEAVISRCSANTAKKLGFKLTEVDTCSFECLKCEATQQGTEQ